MQQNSDANQGLVVKTVLVRREFLHAILIKDLIFNAGKARRVNGQRARRKSVAEPHFRFG
jgi:hypothetical protein